MAILIIIAFVLGYALIAFEHPIRIDKAAPALFTGVICWVILVFGIEQMPVMETLTGEHADKTAFLKHALFEHLGSISEILFFLLGAMTIVELVDAHDGFRVITDRIKTTNKVKLLWILAWVCFFMSATLDNMTTTILMCALLRKIMKDQEVMWLFGGFVIISANAGGAWSPIGDVTTIMLWIGGQVSAQNIIIKTILPSMVSLLIPLIVASFVLRKENKPLEKFDDAASASGHITTAFERNLIFILGVASLLFVPVFKALTHLPPYMGILLAVGSMWFVTELIHRYKDDDKRTELSVASTLQKIDTPSILFFLGILLAVGSLETSGYLSQLAGVLDQHLGSIFAINTLIGFLSAIVDNVPMVAACMGMYDLVTYPQDHNFWELLAYCAGTGGSILIIGSAAGVAAMGILKVDFIWYLKRISLYAIIGYIAGVGVYYVQTMML